jgi:DNA-binding transcriptional LysR family regulator
MHFVNQSVESPVNHRYSEIDLIFMPRAILDAPGYSDLRFMHLFCDDFVRVVGPGHPLHAVRKPTERELAKHRQVVFSPWQVPPGIAAAMLPFAGHFDLSSPGQERTRQGLIKVEHFNVLPLLALFADSMALAPRRLIELLQPYMPLRVIGKPLAAIELCLAWSPVHETNPAHRWFRELLRETVGDDSSARK